MPSRDDARVVRTKAKLISNFKKLLEEKPFENITINEMCEKSNIRRATFYKHFYDKYDFLKFYIGSLRDDFDRKWTEKKNTITSSYYTEYIYSLIDFLTENEKIVTNALKSEILHTLIDIIKQQNFEDTKEKLSESVALGMKLPASVDTVAAMMTGAVANALLHWYETDRELSKEKLTEEITAVINAMHS